MLHRIRDAAAVGRALEPADATELVGLIDRHLLRLEEPTAIERRDQAIRCLAEELAPGGTMRAKADAVRAEMRRYLPRWVRDDQHRDTAPATYTVAQALLFEIFTRSRGNPPSSASQLNRILLSRWQDRRTLFT